LGGDEFIVVMEDVAEVKDAVQVAESILRVVADPCVVAGIELRMSASIGISVSPDHGATPEELLKAADAAMYRAKGGGRNGFQFFSAELTERALELFTLKNALRHPDFQDQLVVHYQPQVCLGSGRVLGVEALVRWQHPTRGLLMPGQFVPIAEEAGLIYLIGEWVLMNACRQAKAWERAGYPGVRIAVNVSPAEAKTAKLVSVVEQALSETGLDPELLELEVTEGALQTTDSAVAVLSQLKALGVKLSLDDFGTGYSALCSLKALPFDRVKIDRSFVRDIEHDRDDQALVRAIIAMGKSLGMALIAEGIETPRQLALLRAYGCDEAQGFLIAKPMDAEQIAPLLSSKRHKPVLSVATRN
jgi:predicted signal transduction protein with EAL and GGDEF domain